jgi:hypothetical protein
LMFQETMRMHTVAAVYDRRHGFNSRRS